MRDSTLDQALFSKAAEQLLSHLYQKGWKRSVKTSDITTGGRIIGTVGRMSDKGGEFSILGRCRLTGAMPQLRNQSLMKYSLLDDNNFDVKQNECKKKKKDQSSSVSKSRSWFSDISHNATET